MALQWLQTRIVFLCADTGFCTKSLFYGARSAVILSAPFFAREGSADPSLARMRALALKNPIRRDRVVILSAQSAREGSASTVHAALSS